MSIDIDERDDTTQSAPGFGARLRTERERQGLGVRELSRRLNVSASMISQIERDRVMPSVNTLYSITSALGISFDDLFRHESAGAIEAPFGSPAEAHQPGYVQHRDEQQSVSLASGVRWDLLTSEPHPDVEFLRTTYDPGSESAPVDALMRHSGHEYGTVLDGKLNVTVGFTTYLLEVGDAISFESSVPHRLFNSGDEPATAIWVVVGRGTGAPTRSR